MNKPLASSLLHGVVTHVRHQPREHRLAYRIYSMLLDLDELEALDRRLRLFSCDRFNLFAFHAKDRGDRSGRPLRTQVEAAMLAAGVTPDGGPIRLLTMPRLLGFAFNPLSVYFCHRRCGAIAAILWEVDNTFGQRHGYMIPVETVIDDEIRQTCEKAFYVSPFMDMSLRYAFRVRLGEDALSVVIEAREGERLVLVARHVARHIALTDAALISAFLAVPFHTLRVVGGILWEALKIWMKGIALRVRPPAPAHSMSIVSARPREKEM